MYTQNRFYSQMIQKLVYSTCVHKISFIHRWSQNQFTVHVYTKPVFSCESSSSISYNLSVPVYSHSCVMFRQCDIPVCPCTFQIICKVPSMFMYKCTQNQISVQVYKKPVFSTSVHNTSSQYRCTQNQFSVQVYTTPIFSTGVHKTNFQYRRTQNQFSVQVYTKKVFSTGVHKTIFKNTCSHVSQFTVQLCTKPVYSTGVHRTSLQYTYTQNQFTLQLCTKTVYSIAVHKTSLWYKCTPFISLQILSLSSFWELTKFLAAKGAAQ